MSQKGTTGRIIARPARNLCPQERRNGKRICKSMQPTADSKFRCADLCSRPHIWRSAGPVAAMTDIARCIAIPMSAGPYLGVHRCCNCGQTGLLPWQRTNAPAAAKKAMVLWTARKQQDQVADRGRYATLLPAFRFHGRLYGDTLPSDCVCRHVALEMVFKAIRTRALTTTACSSNCCVSLRITQVQLATVKSTS